MNSPTSWQELITNFTLKDNILTASEQQYLSSSKKYKNPAVEDIWSEMDRIWDALALNNRLPLDDQDIHAFYSHPVWILNGLFTSFDPVSVQHRRYIAKTIIKLQSQKIADYGGGFGELARQLITLSNDISVDIIEPYPSRAARQLIETYPQIKIIPKLSNRYDLIIAEDVLEHIEDPIGLVHELRQATVENGHLIFANCFRPVIKCHLPATFHLRHSFPWVIEPLGLQYCGRVAGASHALIFKHKSGKSDFQKCRHREKISKIIRPLLNPACTFLRATKQLALKTVSNHEH